MKTTKKNSKKRSKRFKGTAKRLAAYSAAAATTIMTAQNTANAVEIIWDIPDVISISGSGPQSVKFNMETGGYVTAANNGGTNNAQGSFKVFNGWQMRLPGNDPNAAFAIDGTLGAPNVEYRTLQATVDSSITWGGRFSDPNNSLSSTNFGNGAQGYFESSGNWFPDDQGILAVKFDLSDGLHYGWMHVTYIGSGDFDSTLHGFGYQSIPNTPSTGPRQTRDKMLEMQIDTATGDMFIVGNGKADLSITGYEVVQSGGGSAAVTGVPADWTTLGSGFDQAGGNSNDFHAEAWLDATTPGDIDGDGDFDGDDFLAWQLAGGTAEELAAWEANYGTDTFNPGVVIGKNEARSIGNAFNTMGGLPELTFKYTAGGGTPGDINTFEVAVKFYSSLSAATAVPEPSSIFLLAAGAAGFGSWRRRKRV
jgi:hypothetical protein